MSGTFFQMKKKACVKKKKKKPRLIRLYRTGKLEASGLVVSGRSILHAVVPFGVGVSLSLLLPSVVFLNKLFNLSEPLLHEL